FNGNDKVFGKNIDAAVKDTLKKLNSDKNLSVEGKYKRAIEHIFNRDDLHILEDIQAKQEEYINRRYEYQKATEYKEHERLKKIVDTRMEEWTLGKKSTLLSENQTSELTSLINAERQKIAVNTAELERYKESFAKTINLQDVTKLTDQKVVLKAATAYFNGLKQQVATDKENKLSVKKNELNESKQSFQEEIGDFDKRLIELKDRNFDLERKLGQYDYAEQLFKKSYDARVEAAKVSEKIKNAGVFKDNLPSKDQMVARLDWFSQHANDAIKSKDYQNSTEFTNMITSIGQASAAVADDNVSLAEKARALQDMGQKAKAYYDAKMQQTRWFPSAQRKFRLNFAKQLQSFANTSVENITEDIPKIFGPTGKTKLGILEKYKTVKHLSPISELDYAKVVLENVALNKNAQEKTVQQNQPTEEPQKQPIVG
ncbi:MAG: hypothetical protein Q4E99_05355, partial [Bacillota bacterium]|nr:hypothetical protein [Bacillota bacterium]